MKEKTAIQTKHADCFRSDTPGSPASFLPVFPFNGTIVGIAAINSVCVEVNSTSSLIVDECERTISILKAINALNDSIFSTTETIIGGTLPIISGAHIVISGTEIIISGTETIICGTAQNQRNDRVPDGPSEIIICELEAVICGSETIICAWQIPISTANTVISRGLVVIDGPDIIISGPHSIIYGHEATMSVVETIVFTTEMDLSKADTIISAFLTVSFATQIVISAAEKTASCSITVGNLFPGTTCVFRVRAVGTTGYSDWSDPLAHMATSTGQATRGIAIFSVPLCGLFLAF